jgi:hypothetical protein
MKTINCWLVWSYKLQTAVLIRDPLRWKASGNKYQKKIGKESSLEV